MAAGQVIEDSDEDEAGDYEHLISLKKAPVIERQVRVIEVSEGSVPQTSSTDPALFQAIYEQHLGVTPLHSNDEQNNGQSQAFENPIMSESISSFSTGSVRKLKRSRTTNMPISTSISEETASNREVKRAKSMKDVEDLIQVTTPRRSKSDRDPWEFLSSSISGGSRHADTKVKSRNAEKSTPLKTYGRLRRSHTLAHTATTHIASSPTYQFGEGKSLEPQRIKHSTEVAADDDQQPGLPRLKMQKRVEPEGNNLLEESSITKDVSVISNQAVSTFEGFGTVQTPRSTSDERIVGSVSSFVGRINQSNEKNSLSRAQKTSLIKDALTTTMSSIMVIPTSLTEKQKLQYDAVSIASSAQGRRSSLPDLMDLIDPNLKYPEESSTIPIETPSPRISSQIAQTPASTILILSSSSPVTSTDRRMKRSRSETGLKGPTLSTMSQSSSSTTKSKGCSKTIVPGETVCFREASFDELSLSQLGPFEMAVPKKRSAKTSNKTAPESNQKVPVIADNPLSSDDIDHQRELDKPRPGLRRSKSMYVQPSQDAADLALSKPKNTRKRSLRITKTTGAIFAKETSQIVGIAQDDQAATTLYQPNLPSNIHQDRLPNDHETKYDMVEVIPAEVEPVPTTPTISAQPKKRGRPKKTFEITIDKYNNVRETQNRELFQAVRKALSIGPPALKKTDENLQPSHENNGTLAVDELVKVKHMTTPRKPNGTVDKQSVQTPTKEAKKGPEQHSPLASGKVPYRVGLSKRTRIAPLLKIIKK